MGGPEGWESNIQGFWGLMAFWGEEMQGGTENHTETLKNWKSEVLNIFLIAINSMFL